VTEVTIPWVAITGSGWPASFNWFGYLSSDNGATNRAFAHAPKENPSINGSSTPLDLSISHYFSVPHVGKYNTTGQFLTTALPTMQALSAALNPLMSLISPSMAQAHPSPSVTRLAPGTFSTAWWLKRAPSTWG
jgi:hypothetical protein